jgi:chemotaxis protein MotB
MRSMMIVGACCVAGLSVATGCSTVSQDKYDNLLTSYRTLQEDNVTVREKLEQSDSANRLLQQRLAEAGGQLNNLEASNQSLRGDIDRMQGDYANLQAMIDGIEIGPLPSEVSIALQRLADQYPGLLTFDPSLGMVRFSSDLTFALGSADLNAQATQSIQALANILNDPAVANFEVKLVGHTDSVPIRNAGTRAKHPTNTHLSVHRAISVGDALIASNVDPRRVQVAGYGPHRPIVAEGPGGAAENRRVEMWLLPMNNATGGTRASTPASAPAIPEEPMK